MNCPLQWLKQPGRLFPAARSRSPSTRESQSSHLAPDVHEWFWPALVGKKSWDHWEKALPWTCCLPVVSSATKWISLKKYTTHVKKCWGARVSIWSLSQRCWLVHTGWQYLLCVPNVWVCVMAFCSKWFQVTDKTTIHAFCVLEML